MLQKKAKTLYLVTSVILITFLSYQNINLKIKNFNLEQIVYKNLNKLNITNRPFIGQVDSPITIVFFSDFSCPSCADMHTQLLKIQKKYPEVVKIVFKNYPVIGGQKSYTAAKVAIAAQKQGFFWEMAELLYGMDTSNPIELAEHIGLDINTFQHDLKEEKLFSLITEDMEEGAQLEIDRTPSVFFNGFKLTDTRESSIIDFIDGFITTKGIKNNR